MEIIIGTYTDEESQVIDIVWNTEKTYDEQDEATKNKVVELASNNPVTVEEEQAGFYPRPTKQKVVCDGFEVHITIIYKHAATSSLNGLIDRYEYNIKEV